jgi:hypothetical protein
MQSRFLFRVARGLAVAVAIVVAHFVIFWLFQNMRIPAPDLGPVFATILAEPSADSDSTVRRTSPAASDSPDEPRR